MNFWINKQSKLDSKHSAFWTKMICWKFPLLKISTLCLSRILKIKKKWKYENIITLRFSCFPMCMRGWGMAVVDIHKCYLKIIFSLDFIFVPLYLSRAKKIPSNKWNFFNSEKKTQLKKLAETGSGMSHFKASNLL